MANRREKKGVMPGMHNLKTPRMAIIGCVGIPNRYGGFESFVENIAPELAASGARVIVTCDKRVYADDLSRRYRGVHRVFIPVSANGALSPIHDLLAFFATAWKVDRILILGVSGGIFFPLFRLLSTCFGAARFAVNIDGVEWQRGKFGPARKIMLYVFDYVGQRFAHGVIFDNQELSRFVPTSKRAACIAYSGDHVMGAGCRDRDNRHSTEVYALTICRIEPENNCEMLIRGFLESDLPRYVFVGNWNASKYGREMRERYAGDDRLDMRDPTFDKDQLHQLRSGCQVYLHGHSVGGTNPSLVEMLFYDAPILCFDCGYHRATAGEHARYFSNADELTQCLRGDLSRRLPDRSEIRERYSRKVIATQLSEFLSEL